MFHANLAIFLPLITSIISGVFALKENSKPLNYFTTLLSIISAIAASILLYNVAYNGLTLNYELLDWINIGDFSANWGVKIDILSATMIFVVNIVSSIVHFYSLGYMKDDPRINRFMSYLSLFTFFMLILVSAGNLLQLFVGWEGVGLCSYLLIGFWYKKESANKAAMKAFITNRVGDFAFLIGLIGIYLLFDTIYFDDIIGQIPDKKSAMLNILGTQINYIDFICMALFIGCMGKSAQLGLHIWLPDAMEGPTPVSALIHAATMVTAGIFLVVRLSSLFELSEITLSFMTIIGGLTAIFAATIAITQNDIKKIIAYSTCSQLGYMFFACGVMAFSAGMFHLVTHAFFKALLFLAAGNVIVAAHHEQNIKNMGGLWRKIPITYILVWIGSLAIAGIPPFSGYYSKDAILEAAFMSGQDDGFLAYILGVTAAFLTAFYSWRLIYVVFHGKTKLEHIEKVPKTMMMPLFILGFFAVIMGSVGYNILHVVSAENSYFGDVITAGHGAGNILDKIHHTPLLIKYLPLVASLSGIIMAMTFYRYRKNMPKMTVNSFYGVYNLFHNKYYIDELYHKYIIKPYGRLAGFCSIAIDKKTIDNLGPNGFSFVTVKLARLVNSLQSGYIFNYAYTIAIGLVVILFFAIMKFF